MKGLIRRIMIYCIINTIGFMLSSTIMWAITACVFIKAYGYAPQIRTLHQCWVATIMLGSLRIILSLADDDDFV